MDRPTDKATHESDQPLLKKRVFENDIVTCLIRPSFYCLIHFSKKLQLRKSKQHLSNTTKPIFLDSILQEVTMGQCMYVEVQNYGGRDVFLRIQNILFLFTICCLIFVVCYFFFIICYYLFAICQGAFKYYISAFFKILSPPPSPSSGKSARVQTPHPPLIR